MAKKVSVFTKTIENGRLRLLPTDNVEETIEKITPAFKRAVQYMIDNRFSGTLR